MIEGAGFGGGGKIEDLNAAGVTGSGATKRGASERGCELCFVDDVSGGGSDGGGDEALGPRERPLL